MYSRIVMDIDDVISTHRNRDYENAIPNIPIIQKMQKLANEGIEFVLFTARGQISCNGNVEEIERTKGPVLRDWLKRYNVPYSELRFGKPIGDVYVDDGSMTPEEFLHGTFKSFKGGSNEYIEQLDKFIVKECKSVDAIKVSDWFDLAKNAGYNVPTVYAKTYNKMRMEFIDGQVCNEISFNEQDNIINKIAMLALSFASVEGEYTFNLEAYKEYIKTNIMDDEYSNHFVEISLKLLEKLGELIIPSFSHGDLTCMNVIKSQDKLYMIDPVPHNEFSSYMMDLAKLRMSINGQNNMFYNDRMIEDNKRYLKSLDRMLNNIGILFIVKILEFTCWVRLIKYRYNNKEQYEKIINKLNELLEDGELKGWL